jgi:cyclic pyranopterin phosphate synthase
MTAEEITKIVEVAKELGIEEVKLTGGEPALREDLEEIIEGMPKDLEISMTTNATLLSDRADRLADAGLRRINVDLPTLNEKKYQWITGKPLLKQAIKGLQAAMNAGLKPIKINMVLLNGVNVDEVERMLEFCADNGLILQLIELLPVNDGLSKFWYDLKPIEKRLEDSAIRVEQREMHWRRKYVMSKGEVEIVRPMHNSEFCLHCNRLRLTSDGYLKPCLMRNDNLVDVLGALRSGNPKRVKEAFLRATELRQPYFVDE